jgi:hypothetical protein
MPGAGMHALRRDLSKRRTSFAWSGVHRFSTRLAALGRWPAVKNDISVRSFECSDTNVRTAAVSYGGVGDEASRTRVRRRRRATGVSALRRVAAFLSRGSGRRTTARHDETAILRRVARTRRHSACWNFFDSEVVAPTSPIRKSSADRSRRRDSRVPCSADGISSRAGRVLQRRGARFSRRTSRQPHPPRCRAADAYPSAPVARMVERPEPQRASHRHVGQAGVPRRDERRVL